MTIYTRYLAVALGLGLAFTSCKKKEEEVAADEFPWQGKTKYVITATPVGTTGVADYLLTTDGLSEGSITTQGNGIEQDGTYRYYMLHKGKFFSFLYGQGNPGAVTTYRFNKDSKLVKTSDFQTESVHTFTPVNDELLIIKVPRSGDPNALAYRISAENSQVVGDKKIDIVQLAKNGERAHFTWARQVGNKVFAPYQSIKGCCGDTWGTSFPDSAWIAVFSYPDLNLEKVIRDTLSSFIGSYFTDGMAIDEKGDVYAFSPGYIVYGGANQVPTKKPSAFTRIKAGTTEFDRSYFFDVEKVSEHKISRQTYLKDGKILLYMYGNKGQASGNVKVAIADLYNRTFTWVTGLPEILSHSTPYNNNTISGDGKTIYLGVNSTDENRVYLIDIATATATKGLKVEGGKITSLVKVDY